METAYRIHSLVRSNRTKSLRNKAPIPHRMTQKLAGGNIILRCARTTVITAEKLMRHIDVLKQAANEGKLEVRTLTGKPVDLITLQVLPSDVAPVSPLPIVQLDSVANDKQNVGENMPLFPGGHAMAAAVETPEVIIPEAIDNEDADLEVNSADPTVARRRGRRKKEVQVANG